MRLFVVLVLLYPCISRAQDDTVMLRGLSVYHGSEDLRFPVLVRKVDSEGKPVGKYGQITVQFDIVAIHPPSLKIQFWHCNRDWKPDENLFVTDQNHNTSFYLEYVDSPGGVEGYRYRYVNKFPDDGNAVRFDYSGNWIFRITDRKEALVLGEGRFFVVDDVVTPAVTVTNQYLTANTSPLNQIQEVTARITLPQEIDAPYFTTVDVYQNRRLYNPYRIDEWDRDSYTMVKGQATGVRTFSISNILPGNEYRTLDLSNTTRYPNKSLVRAIEGVDQIRLYWRTGKDRDGTAALNKFGGLQSDYLEVLFRLDMTSTDYRSATSGGREIYIAGAFNFWNPGVEDKLYWNSDERAYVVQKLLRRGIYDYQYVAGVWNSRSAQVVNQDWVALEGNDWRTTNTYRVFVYYNDPRFGGFDRIVGYGIGESTQALPGSH
ncbi:MAG: DUF5103 domain-containing protein [Ignavibacteriae bacterium]|nr:DUF5103 domain-containing protein [Ignavibacteriota bacterium]